MQESDLTQNFEEYYMNAMQIQANVIDSNVEIIEGARAVGKTDGVMRQDNRPFVLNTGRFTGQYVRLTAS